MIGRLRTVHPTEGYCVIVSYTKVDKMVRITSITTFAGKDIWGQMTSEFIQRFKAEIIA